MHNSDNSARGLIATHSLGFPRIGAQRELKRTVEAYWAGKIDRTALHETARELRRRHWLLQRDAGLTLVPSNDFSFYDHVLDTTCMVGAIPPRFGWKGGEVDLDTMFALARGVRPHSATDALGRTCSCAQPLPTGAVAACEMTKWFDTNYHYIVPELRPDMRFSLGSTKPMSEFAEALALGVKTKPVLLARSPGCAWPSQPPTPLRDSTGSRCSNACFPSTFRCCSDSPPSVPSGSRSTSPAARSNWSRSGVRLWKPPMRRSPPPSPS
jgi:hypothetical protein